MAKAANSAEEQLASVRETIESVAIAIVLAFVLRAFILEAFMIPTGSMAPRLMGKHWQFDCPACGHHYAYGLNFGKDVSISRELQGPAAECPNCAHVFHFPSQWAYSGDRVLVLKYLYRFREPRSWDVVVFKNPLNNEENYIKRLIGLPGMEIEIVHGDVFFRRGKDLDKDGVIDEKDFDDPRAKDECPWQILRKPPKTQEVMWQVIFDNDYQPDPSVYEGEESKWVSPWQMFPTEGAWSLFGGGRAFEFPGSAGGAELRFVAGRDRFLSNYAYNNRDKRSDDPLRDINYDLKLSFMFVPKAGDARVGLHLSSFKDHFRAWLGADGTAVLEHGVADSDGAVTWDRQRWASNVLPPLEVNRGYDVTLAHVDRRAVLWLDGKEVLASTDAQYPPDKDRIVQTIAEMLKQRPEEGLPSPTVAILARGGRAELWHVKLMRDVYYTCPTLVIDGDVATRELGWGTTGNPKVLRKFIGSPDMDEFFVFGDNSPASKDSRMWGYHAPTLRGSDVARTLPGGYEYRYENGTVPRYNLIGKAFFVYWPGGYRPHMLRSLPVVPNVGRMRLIR